MNLLIAPLLLALLAAPADRVKISASSDASLSFTWHGKSVDGTAHQLPIVAALFRYTRPGAQPAEQFIVEVPMAGPIPVGDNTVAMKLAVAGVPAGEWDLQVALKDRSGQVSGYSLVTAKSEVEVFASPPAAPTELRITDS